MQMLQPLSEFVGLIVLAGGGLALTVYGVFKFLAKRWLENKFSERLEAFKHLQSQEIERLRFRINALLDRATKLHQREFEVLPESWSKIVEVHGNAQALVSPFQTHPDLNSMNTIQLDEFLQACDLDNWEKTELKSQSDKTAYYIKHSFWHDYARVCQKAREAHIYLLKNGVFVKEELRTKLKALDDLVWEALIEKETMVRHSVPAPNPSKVQKLREDSAAMIAELEGLIQARLWSQDQDAP
jgi:hypothetical protein